MLHGDDGHDHRGDRHDGELQDVGPHDAEHAAEHRVDRGDRRERDAVEIRHVTGRDVEWHVRRDLRPRQEGLDEDADADEAVGEESEHAQHGEADHDVLRELAAEAGAEAGLDPLGAGEHVRAAQPGREVDHQEHLVEHRPQPRNPDALQAVHDAERDEPHRAGDVEHAGRVRQAQHVPGEGLAGEVVRFDALRSTAARDQADRDGRQHVQAYDGQVDGLHARRSPPDRPRIIPWRDSAVNDPV